jgi:hypothetical protein
MRIHIGAEPAVYIEVRGLRIIKGFELYPGFEALGFGYQRHEIGKRQG